LFFLHPTSLTKKYFPVLQFCVVLQGLPVIVPKSRWLVLFLLELVEGELRPYQQSGEFELAHLPVLLFLLSKVQWRLRG